MSKSTQEIVKVKLLENTYQIRCPPERVEVLQKTAEFLEKKLRTARRQHQNQHREQVIALTALNLCQELLRLKRRRTTKENRLKARLEALEQKIEHTLSPQLELEL